MTGRTLPTQSYRDLRRVLSIMHRLPCTGSRLPGDMPEKAGDRAFRNVLGVQ